MSTLQLLLGGSALAALLVFTLTLRAGLRAIAERETRELQRMPEAHVVSDRARWYGTPARRRWTWVPALITAVAFTSVFLMALCFLAVVYVIAAG